MSEIIVGAFLFLQLSSWQDGIGFAESLMRQKDYFRAITEYKRVMYHSENDSLKNYCLLQIGVAYRKSRKIESAIHYTTGLLSRNDVSLSIQTQSNLNLGLAFLESHLPQLSVPYFLEAANHDSSGFPIVCAGVAELEMKNWMSAGERFKAAARLSRDEGLRLQLLRFSDDIQAFPNRPKKSPAVASVMSFILPGSGQVYTGHFYDGLQAFIVTASSAFATYALYRYEHSFDDRLTLTYVGISITAIFHAANIFGAAQTANYHNQKQHQDFVRDAHDAFLTRERWP